MKRIRTRGGYIPDISHDDGRNPDSIIDHAYNVMLDLYNPTYRPRDLKHLRKELKSALSQLRSGGHRGHVNRLMADIRSFNATTK